MSLLEIDQLKVHFALPGGTLRAVDDVSLRLDAGQTLGIVGESGSGKTAMAMSIMRLNPEPPAVYVGGSIRVKGVDVLKLDERGLRAMRGSDVAMIFQDPMTSLNPVTRIGDQIGEAIRLHRNLDAPAVRRRTLQVLTDVRLPDPERVARAYPFELSGGMRQRAMIAMALACEPSILIADEPTTALDVTVQSQILALLNDLRSKYGMAILLISHDLGVIANFADSVAVMYAGRIVETAPGPKFFAGPLMPYSQALLRATPRMDTRQTSLEPIPGQPPSLLSRAPGCRFAPRCTFAVDACFTDAPPVRHAAPAHEYTCVHDENDLRHLAVPAVPITAPDVVATSLQRCGSVIPRPTDILMSVRGVSKRYPVRGTAGRQEVVAVDDVDLDIYAGETIGLVGESGSGKSTLARIVSRLLDPTAGTVRFAGDDVTAWRGERLRKLRQEIQVIFQDPFASLNPRLTVGNIIAEPLIIHGRGDSLKASVFALMDSVGLSRSSYDRYPHEFSGGQRQRVGIARALALKPRLIVCDEAVSALDVSVQAQILNLLGELRHQYGIAYLFIAHDLAVVRHLSDRIAVMLRGRIVEQGTADQICDNPVHEYTRSLLDAVRTPVSPERP